MKEQAKKAAAVGTGGLLGFLCYQYAELAKQNYDVIQRLVVVEERTKYRFGDVTREELEGLQRARQERGQESKQ